MLIKQVMTYASLLNGSIRVSLTTALPQGESGICQGFNSIFQVHRGQEGFFSESNNLLPPLKKIKKIKIKIPPFLSQFCWVLAQCLVPFGSHIAVWARKQPINRGSGICFSGSPRQDPELKCFIQDPRNICFLFKAGFFIFFLILFLLPSPSYLHKHLCAGKEPRREQEEEGELSTI